MSVCLSVSALLCLSVCLCLSLCLCLSVCGPGDVLPEFQVSKLKKLMDFITYLKTLMAFVGSNPSSTLKYRVIR